MFFSDLGFLFPWKCSSLTLVSCSLDNCSSLTLVSCSPDPVPLWPWFPVPLILFLSDLGFLFPCCFSEFNQYFLFLVLLSTGTVYFPHWPVSIISHSYPVVLFVFFVVFLGKCCWFPICSCLRRKRGSILDMLVEGLGLGTANRNPRRIPEASAASNSLQQPSLEGKREDTRGQCSLQQPPTAKPRK